jgi:hypothetical protein
MPFHELNVESYFISDDVFEVLASEKKLSCSECDVLIIKENSVISDEKLSKAKIIYSYLDCSKMVIGTRISCDVVLMQDQELSDATLYLDLQEGQLVYRTKISPIYSSLESTLPIDLINRIKVAIKEAEQNKQFKIGLLSEDKTLLIEIINASNLSEQLEDDYIDVWNEFDPDLLRRLLEGLIPKVSDSCIFALLVQIQNPEKGSIMTHAVPFIFNKRGETLYFCSILGIYDNEVRQLHQIINDLLIKNNCVNPILYKKEILQNDHTSCSFYSSSALFSLLPDEGLGEQFEVIASKLQVQMNNEGSKIALRKNFLEQLKKSENKSELKIENELNSNKNNLFQFFGSSDFIEKASRQFESSANSLNINSGSVAKTNNSL